MNATQTQAPVTRGTTRKPVKALNKSAEAIQANAAAEKARKAASKKVLKGETPKAPRVSKKHAAETARAALEATPKIDHEAQDRANALATAKADAEATGRTLEEMLAEMGIDETGAPIQADKTKYHGPMLALRQRQKQGAYQKAANGQPSCGDDLAKALGVLPPAQVIRACVIALNLEGNPYTHLNIGQQSMNLRNKLRGALIRGEFGMGVVTEAIEEAQQA